MVVKTGKDFGRYNMNLRSNITWLLFHVQHFLWYIWAIILPVMFQAITNWECLLGTLMIAFLNIYFCFHLIPKLFEDSNIYVQDTYVCTYKLPCISLSIMKQRKHCQEKMIDINMNLACIITYVHRICCFNKCVPNTT